MPKVQPPSERAVAAARRVLGEGRAGCTESGRIDIEALAAAYGAMVLYGPLSTARGALVRAGDRAIIHVDHRARWLAWARFTIAHELGHLLLHALVDHYTQCTTAELPRGEDAFGIEREASDFGTELLVPEARATPYCAVERAGVDQVDRLARAFGTSFEMSAIRFVELTMAPCAVVVSEGDAVKWALESLTFPGTIAKWRPLHPLSMAARLPARVGADREREVPGAAWKSGRPLIERAWRTRRGRTLSWIVEA
jgi:Zn-dependent peptidase ImmA (M78 family)